MIVLAYRLVLASLLVSACSTATSQVDHTASQSIPDELSLLLPAAPPHGFAPAVDVQPRSTEDIFEQINGGSFSFLENGMVSALFATYPLSAAEEGIEIALEVYRFRTPGGALVQFTNLHGEDGTAWEGTYAVIHEYGVELVKGHLLIRATFNDGPETQMVRGSKFLARHVLAQVRSSAQ